MFHLPLLRSLSKVGGFRSSGFMSVPYYSLWYLPLKGNTKNINYNICLQSFSLEQFKLKKNTAYAPLQSNLDIHLPKVLGSIFLNYYRLILNVQFFFPFTHKYEENANTVTFPVSRQIPTS